MYVLSICNNYLPLLLLLCGVYLAARGRALGVGCWLRHLTPQMRGQIGPYKYNLCTYICITYGALGSLCRQICVWPIPICFTLAGWKRIKQDAETERERGGKGEKYGGSQCLLVRRSGSVVATSKDHDIKEIFPVAVLETFRFACAYFFFASPSILCFLIRRRERWKERLLISFSLRLSLAGWLALRLIPSWPIALPPHPPPHLSFI